MAKNKQQKKKDREKRVAKEKHAADTKKRTTEKTNLESKKPLPARTQLMRSAVPKADKPVAAKKNTFTQRRTGG